MTTSPSEPVENDQSGNDDADTIHDGGSDEASGSPDIKDEDLPEDLRPSEDNPLAVNPDEGSGGDGGAGSSGGGPLEDASDSNTDQPTNDPTGGTPL